MLIAVKVDFEVLSELFKIPAVILAGAVVMGKICCGGVGNGLWIYMYDSPCLQLFFAQRSPARRHC